MQDEKRLPLIDIRFTVDTPTPETSKPTIDAMLAFLRHFGDATVDEAKSYYKFPDTTIVDVTLYPFAPAHQTFDKLTRGLQPPVEPSRVGDISWAWSARTQGGRLPGFPDLNWFSADLIGSTQAPTT